MPGRGWGSREQDAGAWVFHFAGATATTRGWLQAVFAVLSMLLLILIILIILILISSIISSSIIFISIMISSSIIRMLFL